MRNLLLPTMSLLLLWGQLSFSQQRTTISTVAALLFNNTRTHLTPAEMNYIAAKLGFVASGVKEQPFAQDKQSLDYPFNAIVYPTDLNKDGKEEIFVLFGNSYTSGQAGSSITLFIKNGAGTYVQHLGFPGMAPDVLATISKGYPDLLIGGPGFEYPVWRWNGRTYNLLKMVRDDEYNNLKKANLESLVVRER